MLTNAAVKAARPRAAAYKLFDQGGLHLYVAPTGRKSFRMKFRMAGKEQLLTIGAVPEVSPDAARARCDQVREQLGRGEQLARVLDLEQRRVMLCRRWGSERAADDRRGILVDQILGHRIREHGRDPLANPTRRLEAAPVLDDPQRVQNHGNGHRADRHRADRWENVALERPEDVAGMHVRPAQPHMRVPLARDVIESTSLAGLRKFASPGILTAAELGAHLVAPGPGRI